MHLHVRAKFPRQFLRVEACEAVDYVVSLRAVGEHSLPVKKIAPLDDHLGDALIACQRPIMEERIEQQRHHPGRCGAFESRFIWIVEFPVLPQRAIGRSPVWWLALVIVIGIDTLASLLPVLPIA